MRVHDLFLIWFSGGNSPNRAVSSCENAITHEKPYKVVLGVGFSGVHCLLLMESVLLLNSV